MQFTIIVAFAVIGCALAEQCTTNTDCVATSCSAGSVVVCQHDNADGGVSVNGGLCTCADSTTGECITGSDCYGDKAPSLRCEDNARHCYDNTCICDRFPIGGKRMALF